MTISAEFCTSPVWDNNLTWNSSSPDFTSCFQSTILIWVPCLVLVFLAPTEFLNAYNSFRRPNIWTKISVLKMALNIFLLALAFVNVVCVTYAASSEYYDEALSSVVAVIVEFITYAFIIFMVLYIRRKGVATSKILSLFWLMHSLSLLIRFYSSFLNEQCTGQGNDMSCLSQTLLRIIFPVVLILLVLSSHAEHKSDYDQLEDSLEDNCQLRNSSLFSCLFFTWMARYIFKGQKKKLQSEDFPSLCEEMNSYNLSKKFDKEFNSFPQRSLEDIHSNSHETVQVVKPSKSSLLFLLLKITWWPFLISSITEILYIFFSLLPPIMLKFILGYLQTPEELWHGYIYAFGYFITIMLQSITMNISSYFSSVASICIQSALTSAIYKKLFRYDYAEHKQYTAGEIVNLVSVDTWEIIHFTDSISAFWGIPIQIGVAFYFLWQILGISSLGSIGVIIVLSPISIIIGKYTETLQTAIMSRRDERMKGMSEILNGMKVLKLYAWEKPFMERIRDIRNKELKILRIACYVYAFFTFIWSSTTDFIMLVCFALYSFINPNQQLTVQVIFVSLSYISLLHVPVTRFPELAYSIVRANVSYKRISEFLFSKEIDSNVVGKDPQSDFAVTFSEASFTWSFSKDATLRNITLKIPKGSLTAIVGSVGCGKSSMFSAIIGDMKKLSGDVTSNGSIGYVAQQAWIQNATLQKNILFVKEMNERLYRRIIKACALKDDLEILQGGDLVEIGEKGINLSGGQKQRVCLARAVYQDVDVYLLDDPLSAVDANVASHLFQEVIGPAGLLRDKTRILATHNVTFLAKVDKVIMMDQGEIVEEGSYAELMEKRGKLFQFLEHHLSEKERDQEYDVNEDLKLKLQRNISVISNDEKIAPSNEASRLIEDESTEFGRVNLKIYKGYIQKIGAPLFGITVFAFLAACSSETASGLWLSHWSTSGSSIEDKDLYLGVYGGIVGCSALLNIFAYSVFFFGCVKASDVLHHDLLFSVMRSPLSFFDTTPVGRILNRFSQDIESMDEMMPFVLSSWITCIFYILLLLGVIAYASVYMIIVLVATFFVYLYILKIYINSSNQMQRLDSITKSPIYSNVSETLHGVSTIRAFDEKNYFIERSNTLVDENLKCHYFSNCGGRWLNSMLSVVSGLIILASALMAVAGTGTINAGLVGLALNYASQISSAMSWLIQITSGLEQQVVALERIDEFSNLGPEAAWDIDETKPLHTWPEVGKVEFTNFSVKYREGLELVLKDVELKILPSTKIGIVGRTGSGKSSLILSLFRIMEPFTGKITIDDVDITHIGLYDLRSQLTVIPQDPVLFAGSLRMNLDPWNEKTDEEIWTSLDSAHLKTFVLSLDEGLLYEITEGGANLSAGQKQLVCLSRALLRHTKILILDEATASVDLDTDKLIQSTIRQAFSDCTIITVAHRLNTIMDYDRIIVLADGMVIEEGSPESLLQKPESHFYKLAKDANLL